jgi:predicted metalloprotease with PDZ domain
MKNNILLLAGLLLMSPLFAQYKYTLCWEKPQTHNYNIEVEVAPETPTHTDFQVAVWRPGRYITQDYAAAVSKFLAKDENGKPLKWEKVNPSLWRVYNEKASKVIIQYQYYANNEDAGSSYLSDNQAYFNPVNLFMYIPSRVNDKVTLVMPDLNKDWKAATALTKGKDFHTYTATSFHELADCPSVFSPKMKDLGFRSGKTQFYIHFQGEYQGNAEVDSMIVQNLRKICQEQASIFGGFPFSEYHFIYRLLNFDMRHAVEHTNSASFALPYTVTANKESVVGGICNISSHEFWHAWNVKRIRPASLYPYDYRAPQYTGLHWFTEGVTEYYTTLLMARAGVIPQENFLTTMANNIRNLENSYANTVISPYQASFDSWLAPSDYMTPHLATSYYPLGERVGFLLDVKMRNMTKGKKSLDDVFRYLYKEYYEKDKGVPEEGIQKAVETLTGESWKEFFEKYVNGVEKIDYEAILKPFGLEVTAKEAEVTGFDKIGISRQEKTEDGWYIQKLNPAGDAYRDGLATGDVIIKIAGKNNEAFAPTEYFAALRKGDPIRMEVFRGGNVVNLVVKYNAAYTPMTYSIKRAEKPSAEQEKMLNDWLKSNQ